MSAVITCYPYGNAKLAGEYRSLKVREEGRLDSDGLREVLILNEITRENA